jgi:hypothetical protein
VGGLLAAPIAPLNVNGAHLAMIVHHLAKGSVACPRPEPRAGGGQISFEKFVF